jgi:hypothetical protein
MEDLLDRHDNNILLICKILHVIHRSVTAASVERAAMYPYHNRLLSIAYLKLCPYVEGETIFTEFYRLRLRSKISDARRSELSTFDSSWGQGA